MSLFLSLIFISSLMIFYSTPAVSGDDGDEMLYWIYFAPRPEIAFSGPSALSSRAVFQREKSGIPVLESDYPVWAPWVEEITSLGVKPRFLSRYFHAVSASLNPHLFENVSRLPFVDRIIKVRAGSLKQEPVEITRPISPLPPHSYSTNTASFDPSQQKPATPSGLPSDYGASFGQLAQLGIPDLHHDGYSGTGVLVAIMDSGFHKDHYAFDHLDIVAERDFIDGDMQTQNYDPETSPGRGDYHGTYSLSALAGLVPGELVGPAWNASFLLARSEILEEERRLEEDAYVAALEWASAEGARIISTSLGYWSFLDDGFTYPADSLDGFSAVTTRAVNIAYSEGILVVTSAGNKGPGDSTLLTPGDSPYALAIGAVTPWNTVTSFSSRGPTFDSDRIKPDLCGTGKYTVCAHWDVGVPNSIGRANGTSLSAPLIAGLAALMLEANPEWTVDSLLTNLRTSGDTAANPDMARGYGVPWGPVAAHLPGATLAVDSLSWSVAPQAGSAALISLSVTNRGSAPSAEASLSIFAATAGLTFSPEAVSLPELLPGQKQSLGPWEILFSSTAGLDAESWVSLTLEMAIEGQSLYRVVSFTLEAPEPGAKVAITSISPNPWFGFESPLHIDYRHPDREIGSLFLYDINGRLISRLLSEVELAHGQGRLEISADRLRRIPGGCYYLQISSIYGQSSQKLIRFR